MSTKSTVATPVAAQSATLISPVLLECMAQLKEVHHKICEYYKANKDNGLKYAAGEEFMKMDSGLNDIADDLSEFIRYEVLGNTFYAE